MKGRRRPVLPPRDDTAGFIRLQRGLTGERALIGEAYMEDRSILAAYLDYYWPVSRAQAAHAIAVSNRFAFKPHSIVIDVGSGPGPVAAALIDTAVAEVPVAVTLIDQSRRALDLAVKELTSRCRRDVSLATVVADISLPDPRAIPHWGEADCISFGHCLNELFAGMPDRLERRADLLARYAEGLRPGGRLLLIEPALLSTSRDLIKVRNLLTERGWSVVAPCCGRERLSCPAVDSGEQHTCHDEIPWRMPFSTAKLAATLKLDKDSLKMTWFMLEPPGASPSPLVRSSGLEGSRYRVVSDPMLNKSGRVRKLICGSAGRFPLSVAEGHPDSERSGFNPLRRGDTIRVIKPVLRENGWGVGPETRIEREEGEDS